MVQSPRSSTESQHGDSTDGLLKYADSPSKSTMCPKCKSKSVLRGSVLMPWMVALFLLVVVLIRQPPTCYAQPENSYWRTSDFETVKHELQPVFTQVKFTATLKYNESHQLYRPVTEPAFVGTPSPEIDAAWKELLGAVNIFVTPEEERALGGNLWLDPETGLHTAMVSVFHDLHCVNQIRKSMSLDYYVEEDSPTLAPHIEHCLDALRLSLMCTGDMTMMPIKWSENRNWIEPIFETVHTCRDYNALKRWSLNRDSADPDTYPKNAESLRQKMSDNKMASENMESRLSSRAQWGQAL